MNIEQKKCLRILKNLSVSLCPEGVIILSKKKIFNIRESLLFRTYLTPSLKKLNIIQKEGYKNISSLILV